MSLPGFSRIILSASWDKLGFIHMISLFLKSMYMTEYVLWQFSRIHLQNYLCVQAKLLTIDSISLMAIVTFMFPIYYWVFLLFFFLGKGASNLLA